MQLRSFTFLFTAKEDIKMNGNKKNLDQSSDSQAIQIARLSFIGASIVTLGDGISAIAAGLALEALENSSNQNSQNSDINSKQSEDMQKQMDYLINELKHIKKMMR